LAGAPFPSEPFFVAAFFVVAIALALMWCREFGVHYHSALLDVQKGVE
jgi:hypothetical protein